MKFLAQIAALALAGSLVSMTGYAQNYPSRPVRIFIGTPAGGPGDLVSRATAQILGQVFGQPFVVENRVGADSMIAGEACARSAPDGHTLCVSDSYGIALNPVIRSRMSYDPQRDLVPVVHYGYLSSGVYVHPSVPANTLLELFELAKARPGTITFGTTGLASTTNIYIEWLKNARGILFYKVPYKAASLAWPALLAGEVQVSYYSVGLAAPSVRAGKIKAMFVTTEKRSPQLPEVPTYKEAGMGIKIGAWFGLFAPAGTPRDIVQRLNAEVSKGLIQSAAAREKYLTPVGIQTDAPAGASPEDFAAFSRAERDRYAGIVKVAGIKVE